MFLIGEKGLDYHYTLFVLQLYGTAAIAMPYNRGISNEDAEMAKSRILANRYQVIKKIGSGNFGTAFLVKDLNPGKTDE